MTTTLAVIGLIFAIAGLIGCFLPFIPGPSFSLISLFIISYANNWKPFSLTFLAVMVVAIILVTAMDYVVPAAGAKKYGASQRGIWGSIIGMFLGLFFFPPWGMILGAFIGALAGEMIAGRKGKKALRVVWGIFIGNMISVGIKLTYAGIVLFFYIKEMLTNS
jgi:uncharacterized protein YqgC (DUF456 family)